MKKAVLSVITVVLAVFICLTPGVLSAEAWDYDDYFYFDTDGEQAILTYADGYLSGEVVIPSEHEGYPVSAIGSWAFEECTEITGVTIPRSVTSIHRYAFYGCTGMTSITVPGTVTSIGDRAFGYCSDEDYWEDVKISGFTVYGGESSPARQYAEENGFSFVPVPSGCIHSYKKHFEIKATCTDTGVSYDVCESCGECVNYTIIPLSKHVDANSDLLCDYCGDCIISGMRVAGVTYTMSGSAASVKWNKLPGATGYKVYKYNFDYRQYEVYDDVTGNSVSVRGIVPNSTVYIKIRPYKTVSGYNYFGANSPVLAIYAAPAKVTGVTASAITENTLRLTWAKTAGATGYRVYKYDGELGKYVAYRNVRTNALFVSGLKENSTVYFKVRAYKTVAGKNYWGDYSDFYRTHTAPAQVAGVRAASVSKNSVRLVWQGIEGVKGYRVYRYFPATNKYAAYTSTAQTACTVTGLTPGTEYYFVVRAYSIVSGISYWGSVSAPVRAVTR